MAQETDPEALEDMFDEVLGRVADRMAEAVEEGNYGAQAYDDDSGKKNGYYLVRWEGTPYTLQEDTESQGNIIPAGEVACKATYLYDVERAPHVYTNPKAESLEEAKVLVRMQHVIDADVKLAELTDISCSLPVRPGRTRRKRWSLEPSSFLKPRMH